MLTEVVAQKASRLAQAHTSLLNQPVIAKAVQNVGRLASQDYLQVVSVVSGLSTATLDTQKVELPWLRQRLEVATIETNVSRNGTGIVALPKQSFANASSRIAVLSKVAKAAPIRAIELIKRTDRYLPNALSFGFCIPTNPVIGALRLRAELNLYKLRTCRNIAGVERRIDPYATPTDVESGLPQIGAGGQLVLPGVIPLQPTPYRYAVLIERAKQLVQLATQIESALLSVLEKLDAEYFNLLKARQDVRLTRAGVRLQDLRVKEAEDGVKLAELQQERAQIQADYYIDLLDEGLIELEQVAIGFMIASAALSTYAAVLFGGSATLAAITFGLFGDEGEAALAASALANAASTTAQILSTLASYERRKQEWEFQQDLALQDKKIGAQQVRITEDQVRVVGQERTIAMMQADNRPPA